MGEDILQKRNVYGDIDRFSLGSVFHSIMEQQNVSRATISNATGYSYLKVRHYEIGNALLTLNFLFKFSRIFGCSIDEKDKVATERI